MADYLRQFGVHPLYRLPSEQEKAKLLECGVNETTLSNAAKDNFRNLNSWGVAACELVYQLSEIYESRERQSRIPPGRVIQHPSTEARDITALRSENKILRENNAKLRAVIETFCTAINTAALHLPPKDPAA